MKKKTQTNKKTPSRHTGKAKSKRKNKPKFVDPYAQREAQRYENPIPSREAILAIMRENSRQLSPDEVVTLLGLKETKSEFAVYKRLNAMVRDGQLIQTRKNLLGVVERMDLIPGRVIGHADGFGFLSPDAGGDDVFLSPKQMRRVLHGDRVLVSVTRVNRRGKREGVIVEILEHVNKVVTGRFIVEDGFGFVVPDDRRIHQDILIKPEDIHQAKNKDLVCVEITRQPDRHRQPMGQVTEVLGRGMNANMAIEMGIRSFGLPHGWSQEIQDELEQIPDEVKARPEKYNDLRHLSLVTIDGADARDFDDAVCCEKTKNGWRLWVAIADVSAYVMPETALDIEAENRGTSVYFPSRVVPMLPEKLSNGLCSINPDVDRLALVCEMQISEQGEIDSYLFQSAIMRSKARLTYQQVWNALSGEKDNSNPANRQLKVLNELYALYKVLEAARVKRGALEIESQEPIFHFTESGDVDRIELRSRNDAHKLIEECMISANICAAKFLSRYRFPGPYRIHESPSQEKLEKLREFLRVRGIKLSARGKPKPWHFAEVLKQAKGRPDQSLIEIMVLRSQNLAIYSTENKGHFGLALNYYTHFTSPIRRYADLLVHRAIKHRLSGKTAGQFIYTESKMKGLCEHTSLMSKRADDASRDVMDRLKCLYMQERIGEQFEGLVSGVTSFGLFVEITENQVSGLVHISALPHDYYHFDPIHMVLKGERGGRNFRLGDTVRVEVARVNVDDRKIDLELLE
ncbi:MAG: ribonuclease R [bacterium]